MVCFYSPNITDWSIDAVVSDPNYGSQSAVLGTILFNFGFVTTIPSWVNEKKPDVSVNKVVWYSSFACVAIFFLIGELVATPCVLARRMVHRFLTWQRS